MNTSHPFAVLPIAKVGGGWDWGGGRDGGRGSGNWSTVTTIVDWWMIVGK